jgi:hypothetical protein
VTEIAQIKLPDLNAYDLEAAKRQVRGHRPLDGHRRRRLIDPSAARALDGSTHRQHPRRHPTIHHPVRDSPRPADQTNEGDSDVRQEVQPTP